MCHRPDPLRPAYGIVRGLAISLTAWAAIALVWWAALSRLDDHLVASALDRQETALGASFRTADGGVR